MLEADEVSQNQLLSLALSTGELRTDEAAQFQGMVRQLQSIRLLGRAPDRTPSAAGVGDERQ